MRSAALVVVILAASAGHAYGNEPGSLTHFQRLEKRRILRESTQPKISGEWIQINNRARFCKTGSPRNGVFRVLKREGNKVTAVGALEKEKFWNGTRWDKPQLFSGTLTKSEVSLVSADKQVHLKAKLQTMAEHDPLWAIAFNDRDSIRGGGMYGELTSKKGSRTRHSPITSRSFTQASLRCEMFEKELGVTSRADPGPIFWALHNYPVPGK